MAGIQRFPVTSLCILLLPLVTSAAAAADAAEFREPAVPRESDTADPLRSPLSSALDGEWRQFKLRHAKRYASELDEKYRRLVWQTNLQRVLRHNLLAEFGLRSFTLGVNQFADLTPSEFAASAALAKIPRSAAGPPAADRLPLYAIGLAARIGGRDPPARVDWRLKGCVSLVRDQGAIGSAAVYGVVGSVEGQLCARYGHQRAWLSNQQVIDCAESSQTPEDIYAYLASNQGRLDVGIPDTCYPETGRKGPCAFKANCTAAVVQGAVNIPAGSEAALQLAVASAGPATVTVDASQPSFQLYHSGVYNEPNCSSQSLDHVMLVVGYGVATTGEPYWLVKNSWGSGWGEGGYILMSRNRGNQCGIASAASYAIAAPPN